MRIFIVGASGYVGGHLVRSLVHSGYEVAALARSGEAACRITALGARACAGDLSADDMLAREHERADAIIYVAQFPSVSEERRSEEHTSELQSLMRISYAVFCLKKKKKTTQYTEYTI